MNRITKHAICAALIPLLIRPGTAARSMEYGSVIVDEVTSVYDGDTFRITISVWPTVIGYRIPVRIAGIDAPELRGKCATEKSAARRAKQFTVSKLRAATTIELRHIHRGKYFRLLAEVWLDGENLADALIEAGYARPYKGGLRQPWCP